jgi:hypothetical protein
MADIRVCAEHVFMEEQEPDERLILPPCLLCGASAMAVVEAMGNELDAAYSVIRRGLYAHTRKGVHWTPAEAEAIRLATGEGETP